MTAPSATYSANPAVVAFELLALPDHKAKQGLSLRVLMDAHAARMMICGMTGATTGGKYSNGEIAQWMATILSSNYSGDGTDSAWAESFTVADKDNFGSAYAIRASLDTWENTAAALRVAASKLIARVGNFCLVEYGYCDTRGQGPGLSDWTEQHTAKVLGRVANSESMSTAFMIFTDQRAALKSAKAEAALSPSTAATPAGFIAAAIALETDD